MYNKSSWKWPSVSLPKARRKRTRCGASGNKGKKGGEKKKWWNEQEWTRRKRGWGGEQAEWPKRRKVNIARDGIRRNYCCIKIYRISEVRLGKLIFIVCAFTRSLSAFQYSTHRNGESGDRGASELTKNEISNIARERFFKSLEIQARSRALDRQIRWNSEWKSGPDINPCPRICSSNMWFACI